VLVAVVLMESGCCQSVDYKCETCGRIADLLPELETEQDGAEEEEEKKPSKYADQIAQLHMHSLEKAPPASSSKEEAVEAATAARSTEAEAPTNEAVEEDASFDSKNTSTEKASKAEEAHGAAGPTASTAPTQVPIEQPAQAAEAEAAPAVDEPHQNMDTPVAAQNVARVRESDSVDTFLHYLTVGIVVALFALIYKKLLQMHGVLQ